MQIIKLKFSITLIQLFFIEKAVELLHRNTIDTFRLRINNSKSIIKELIDVCTDLRCGRLKNHDYARLLAKECIRTIGMCDIISFKTISKVYFINKLEEITKSKKEDYGLIIHAGKIVLAENEHLTKDVFNRITKTILANNYKSAVDNKVLNELSDLIHFFLIELVYMGYTKHYLVNFFMAIFAGIENLSFLQRLLIIKGLLTREHEEFNIVFGINADLTSQKRILINNDNVQLVTKRIRTRLKSISNEECEKFFSENANHHLYHVKVSSIDYFSALLRAREDFMNQLDILHLGYSNERFHLIDDCLIIGELNPDKASIGSTNYKFDGLYRSKRSLYKYVLKRFHDLDHSAIKSESLKRIYSGLRYFRFASESNEIEIRFINYWIALEYIFSTSDASQYTIGRIREYFKNCHALIYYKRNLTEYHREIKKMALDKYIAEYSDDLNYLKKIETYNVIISKSNSPLLKKRTEYYKERLESPEKLRGSLERHKQNIEWNLTRIYRIRNEIVHNAATKANIITTTSHLRYYLTFILNSILDFFIQNQSKYSPDNQLDIDDYFILQNLKISSLESSKEGIRLENLISVENPLEIFT